MTESPQALSRKVARTFAVAALSLLVVVTTLPGLSFVWNSQDAAWGVDGELGFQTDYDGLIRAVAAHSPGARAGVEPKDRVDLFRTPFDARAYVAGSPARVAANQRIPLWISHQGEERQVELQTLPADYPPISKLNLVLRALAALIFVIVGGSLVLLRPSEMTWGFFLYCLGFSPGIAFSSFSRYPSASMHALNIICGDLLTAAGTVGILAFALNFLCENPAPWRRWLQRSIPVLAVLFALLIVYPDAANLLLGWPAELAQRIMLSLQGLVFALSVVAAFQTYIHGRADNRPRMQWVVVGLVIGTLGTYLGSVLSFSSELPFITPKWFQNLLLLLNITLPLTVAYAVIRHRVFEVSFVVSRALVYAVLTSFIVGVFALIEWFVGQELAAARLALAFEIAAAVAVSFWVNSLEKRIESTIDGVFFRRRREAMRRLERDSEALQHATKSSTVDGYVVKEPALALSLSSSALFRLADGGEYKRELTQGWPDNSLERIDCDDPLVLTMAAEWEPIRLAGIGWSHAGVPAGSQAPVIAVPLMARGQLAGFALYGAHTNGADVDPEEVKSLSGLCRAAQATYDDLRVESLCLQLDALRAQVATLQNGAAEGAAQTATPKAQT